MAKHFSKSKEKGMSNQLRAIRKLCQDACQCLMLHTYITASNNFMVNIIRMPCLEEGVANTAGMTDHATYYQQK